MIAWLDHRPVFPPLSRALAEPNGLLAVGGDLSPGRLLAAYHRGIFPWYARGEPILWWSPTPRMVIRPPRLRVSRSLAKTLRNRRYRVTVDRAFRAVVEGCAAPREPGGDTWIVPEMVEAYCRLHEQGHAHSFETWIDGELVGGLYGVGIGTMFYGESMFSRASDASKIAFVHMVRHLQGMGVAMIDCQMHTPHLESLGAELVPREAFVATLKLGCASAQPASMWDYDYSNEPA